MTGSDVTPQAVQSCHNLIGWIIPKLDTFPRARRFTLGERLESSLLEVLELLTEAAYSAKKSAPLHRANLRLQVARHLWHFAYELKTIPYSPMRRVFGFQS